MAELGLQPPGAQAPPLRVAYHAACSLQHGQQIRTQPKALLKAAGFEVVEPRDSHLCCGSAGTYNLMQPEISGELRARKVATLEERKPDVIAAGNIGCMVQIGSAHRGAGRAYGRAARLGDRRAEAAGARRRLRPAALLRWRSRRSAWPLAAAAQERRRSGGCSRPRRRRRSAASGGSTSPARRFCTATLIAPDVIVTAAHCLFHPRTGARVPRLRAALRRRAPASASAAACAGWRGRSSTPDFAFEARRDLDGVRRRPRARSSSTGRCRTRRAAVRDRRLRGRRPGRSRSSPTRSDRAQAPSIEAPCGIVDDFGPVRGARLRRHLRRLRRAGACRARAGAARSSRWSRRSGRALAGGRDVALTVLLAPAARRAASAALRRGAAEAERSPRPAGGA